jgi:hypothetical protein
MFSNQNSLNVSIPQRLPNQNQSLQVKTQDQSATVSISQSYKKKEVDYDWTNFQAEYSIPPDQKSLSLSFCNTSGFTWTKDITLSAEYGVDSLVLELPREVEPGALYECSLPLETRQDCTFLVQFKGRDELACIKFFSRRMESYIKFT